MGCGTSSASVPSPSGDEKKSVNTTQTSSVVQPDLNAPIPVENWGNGDRKAVGLKRLWNSLSLKNDYYMVRVLGEGASCSVLAVQAKDTRRDFAVKILTKESPESKAFYDQEVGILEKLHDPSGHPSILEYSHKYEDKNAYCVFTGLCTGGELFDKIVDDNFQDNFSEARAAWLTRQCLQSLVFCHERSITHRDIKPENFVFQNTTDDSPMKLIDFGVALHATSDEQIDSVVGSMYYIAPEVLRDEVRTGETWRASDMWSVGVIVYLLVCGYPPFAGRDLGEIKPKILRGRVEFPLKGTGTDPFLSFHVQDLIKKLLHPDPRKRITAAQALKHPWVTGDQAPTMKLPDSVRAGLIKFRMDARLKKAISKAMSNRMTKQQEADLQVLFEKFDRSGDGKLSADEISAFMTHIGGNEKDAQAFMKRVDDDGDGVVTKEEFRNQQILSAVVNDDKAIKESFDVLDANKDGDISMNEVAQMCDNMSKEQVDEMLKDLDANKDGRVTFEEWMVALGKLNAKTPTFIK